MTSLGSASGFGIQRCELGDSTVRGSSLGSDSGFGIQRYELGNATALNRRRHEYIQRIDNNGRRPAASQNILDFCVRELVKLAFSRALFGSLIVGMTFDRQSIVVGLLAFLFLEPVLG